MANRSALLDELLRLASDVAIAELALAEKRARLGELRKLFEGADHEQMLPIGPPPTLPPPTNSTANSSENSRFEPDSLRVIQEAGGKIRAKEFAQRLSIKRSAAAGRLARLESAGLIRRLRRGLYALGRAS